MNVIDFKIIVKVYKFVDYLGVIYIGEEGV